MDADIAEKIGQIRSIGFQFTFDGNSVADFIESLDKVFEIVNVEMSGARLVIYITELRETNIEDLLSLIPMATMLEVAAASFERKQEGYLLWFEWILPKEIARGATLNYS